MCAKADGDTKNTSMNCYSESEYGLSNDTKMSLQRGPALHPHLGIDNMKQSRTFGFAALHDKSVVKLYSINCIQFNCNQSIVFNCIQSIVFNSISAELYEINTRVCEYEIQIRKQYRNRYLFTHFIPILVYFSGGTISKVNI